MLQRWLRNRPHWIAAAVIGTFLAPALASPPGRQVQVIGSCFGGPAPAYNPTTYGLSLLGQPGSFRNFSCHPYQAPLLGYPCYSGFGHSSYSGYGYAGYSGFGYPSYSGYYSAAPGYTDQLYSAPVEPPVAEPVAPAAPARPSPAPAEIDLAVPADAELWVFGMKMDQTGPLRRFVTPPLEPGRAYHYQVVAVWNADGQPMRTTRQFTVRTGDRLRLDLLRLPTSPPAAHR
jgi:uncharacterized protein (TIGR03000 family)